MGILNLVKNIHLGIPTIDASKNELFNKITNDVLKDDTYNSKISCNVKTNIKIMLEPKHYLDEIYFGLPLLNLTLNDLIKTVADKRRKLLSKPELHEGYFEDFHKMQQRTIELLSTSADSIEISDIIGKDLSTILFNESNTAKDYLNNSIICAYYSGESDEYNAFLNSLLPSLPNISIVVQSPPPISRADIARQGLKKFLTSTQQGKNLHRDLSLVRNYHIGALKEYLTVLGIMQSMHSRGRQMAWTGSETVNNSCKGFADSVCGTVLMKDEFALQFEEVVFLSCVYFISHLYTNSTLLSIINTAASSQSESK